MGSNNDMPPAVRVGRGGSRLSSGTTSEASPPDVAAHSPEPPKADRAQQTPSGGRGGKRSRGGRGGGRSLVVSSGPRRAAGIISGPKTEEGPAAKRKRAIPARRRPEATPPASLDQHPQIEGGALQEGDLGVDETGGGVSHETPAAVESPQLLRLSEPTGLADAGIAIQEHVEEEDVSQLEVGEKATLTLEPENKMQGAPNENQVARTDKDQKAPTSAPTFISPGPVIPTDPAGPLDPGTLTVLEQGSLNTATGAQGPGGTITACAAVAAQLHLPLHSETAADPTEIDASTKTEAPVELGIN